MARKVLLADDSVAVQRAVEATLEPKDFEVLSVSKGSEVIREAKNIHPDVILVDGDLSDLDGYEVCRRVKEDPELMSIPVIVMSSEDDPGRALAVGAEAQLAKPFQGNQLLEQVLAVVDLSLGPPVALDTSEMDVLDLGGEGPEEDLDLGELGLEEDVLELTDEMEALEEPSYDLGDTAELALDGLDELDLEAPVRPQAGPRSISTEELEEISFEEEIDELDLGELELEGAEGVGSLEEELGITPPKDKLTAMEEMELGMDLDGELLGTEEEPAGLMLDTQEGPKAETPSDEMIGMDELEALSLEEEERLISMGEEAAVLEDLGEFSTEFEETEELGAVQGEEDFLAQEEILVGEEPSMEAGQQPLEETSLDWEEPAEAESAVSEPGFELDVAALEPEQTSVESTARDVVKELAAPTLAVHEERSPVRTAILEPLEEVGLDEELSAVGAVQEEMGVQPVEILELPLSQIPPLAHGLRLELMEGDFGLVDPFSEEAIRKELDRNLQDMVERILSQIAPPIVERVARAVALEQAERIVLEEIERIRQNPERV